MRNRGVSVGQVLGLAVPALGVLAAEPLYVLVDTAMVGHLGAVALAGLALGGMLLTTVSSQMTFLSYGTTARAARLHGAGRRADAVEEGVQATWLGFGVGLVVLLAGQVGARPVAELLAGPGALADAGVSWLRIALFGAPFILVTMAGNGWMRGVQDTRRPLRYVLAGNGISVLLSPVLIYGLHWGLVGSAVANVAAQVIAAALFVRALLVERVPLRPVPSLIRAQLGLGRDLILRTLSFQVTLLSATTVVARTSADAAAAHQIVYQLWMAMALVLDSLAIAAQSLVGAALGAGQRDRAIALAWQITRYGLVFGTFLGVCFAVLGGVVPRLFTADPGVLAEIPHAWWLFVLIQPAGGVVFALDGVLLGAGDAAYLRNMMLACAFLGFAPLLWLSLFLGWGLTGVWFGFAVFIGTRLLGVVLRTRSARWAVVGADLATEAA